MWDDVDYEPPFFVWEEGVGTNEEEVGEEECASPGNGEECKGEGEQREGIEEELGEGRG